ncbi:F-box-like domain-containing protein [Microdochium nivale]|nr:F-box-like domain-containing protein [Microdochium nivale]
MSLSNFSASLFARLPAELILHILSFCPRNDLICLSLASHYFRHLTLPMVPTRPPLQLYDQNLPSDKIACACGNSAPIGVEMNVYAQRKRRHEYVYESGHRYKGGSSDCHYWGSKCREYFADHVCKQRGCRHCVCISCPLYVRLRSWFGDDLRYCTKCRQFTRREWTKKYKGRCLHGRPKARKVPNNHWTTIKGHSYGYRWWRRWGTLGVDSWGFDDDKHKKDDPSTTAKRRNARVV